MNESLAVWHLVLVAAGLAVSTAGVALLLHSAYSRAIENLHKKISAVSRDLAAHEKEVAQTYVADERLTSQLAGIERHLGQRIDGVNESIDNLIKALTKD